ncbi:MAG: hypothetical protein Q7J44_02810 [Pseudotabrizicola sp.]|uniref:hypothetical protein n=1 Tax=Pseudotabrizicola sp. TaxID=2939647 RepID=UPI002722F231|nr:hypothetical protein [Pseudotabrizicola sp.]MDO9637451.1 hypothetical protein [Pseudotabrizicola sp.]
MGKSQMMKAGVLAALIAATGSFAAAQTVPVEAGVNAGSAVSLHLHPFLTAEELATLRLVATNDQALSLFVTSRTGHAALAISPQDGFVRDGSPVPSAVALGDLPDAAAARTAALAACDQARKGQMPCVVVLEVAPAQ